MPDGLQRGFGIVEDNAIFKAQDFEAKGFEVLCSLDIVVIVKYPVMWSAIQFND